MKINWVGPFWTHSSVSMVNREMVSILVKNGLDVRFLNNYGGKYNFNPAETKFSHLISRASPHEKADLSIVYFFLPIPPHAPLFSKELGDDLIHYIPYEYGSVEKSWVEKINNKITREIWVPTHHVKDCFHDSGVTEDLIQVIPEGIDPEEFKPDIEPFPWLREQIGDRFAFLFNGGVTYRKGPDLLINAYLSEFKEKDNVCLIIKNCTLYPEPLPQKVAFLAQQKNIAKIIYINEDFPQNDLPKLYKSCDCFVMPYRGEGFCLPIPEAMACGLPAIVTGAGACLDYTSEDTVYYIKATIENFGVKSRNGQPTAGQTFWHLPDVQHLRSLMRYVYEHPKEAKEKGLKASHKIRSGHTWGHSAQVIMKRLETLYG